jgi:hypothetical protein
VEEERAGAGIEERAVNRVVACHEFVFQITLKINLQVNVSRSL